MAEIYDHKKIEPKWQKAWEKDKTYEAVNASKKPKKYVLVEFPYPSGEGLHMGHLRPYTAGDVYSRFWRMKGFETLFPIGWDAFGLPAENFAIKNKVHPSVSTAKNVANTKRQLKSWGMGFDWSREVNTTDPEYYKWTQWIFLQFFKAGLAYEATGLINWCPKDKTGLANEEVIDGCCERCGTVVEKKELRQWYLKITAYAEKLLEGLKDLPEWPEPVKLQQENWIGKSEGAEIEFGIKNPESGIKNALLIHGLNGHANENWKPWLRDELEKNNWTVSVPSLPKSEHPVINEWNEALIGLFKENSVVVGHSLGCAAALNLVQTVGKKVDKLILVAPVNPKQDWKHLRTSFPDADWDAVKSFADIKFDWQKISKLARRIVIYYSDNDPYIPLESIDFYRSNLPNAIFKLMPGKGHLNRKAGMIEFPELLTMILTHPLTPSQREGEQEGEFGYHTTDPKTWVALQERVLEMRKNPTEAEEKLWQSLRKNLTGYHFRRQHIIGRFIVDFVCLEKSLVVEVDGDIHDFQKKEDEERTVFLKERGFKVIRFTNEEVIENLDNVLKSINRELDTPPLWGGAGGGVIKVFTTRPDTIYGATYMVLAPEHPLVEEITTPEQKNYVIDYVIKSKSKTDIERSALEKEKTGVFTGAYAINPATKQQIPVWVADYVLMGYGTGAIMAVPQHDERDRQFAEKYKLTIVDKPLVPIAEAIKKFGQSKVHYKLRDWVFSRQRYWGEPIPLIHCDKCGIVAVPEDQLPVKLPEVEKYEPTGTGESPLAVIDEWVNTKCPECGGKAKRETNTMPQWAGSSWYWLRYADPKNDKEFSSKKLQKYWTPVDVYFGGMEHTTLHLLYSRFWNLALYDLGHVTVKEPYAKRVPHGIVLAADGEKMSKSRGNVVNPDEIVKEFGADTMRMYELFLGPHEAMVSWNDKGIVGVKRFLDKVWRYQQVFEPDGDNTHINKLIKKVTSDIEQFKFNTAVAAFMEFLNENRQMSQANWESFLILLSPMAPHITEELWHQLGHKDSIHYAAWPKFDENLTKDETVTVVIQVLGRVRASLELQAGLDQSTIKKLALEDPNVKKHLEGKEIVKEIFVQDKLINFVVK